MPVKQFTRAPVTSFIIMMEMTDSHQMLRHKKSGAILPAWHTHALRPPLVATNLAMITKET